MGTHMGPSYACLFVGYVEHCSSPTRVPSLMDGYEVIGITETWLQGDQGWELNIQGYSTFRKDGQRGKGGGVALLVKEEINAIVRKDIGLDDVESVWVELRNAKGQKTLVGVVYRPSNSSSEIGDSIKQEIRDVCNKGTAIIMGDFNLHIDWANQTGNNAVEEDFLECIRDGFLDQYVEEPTRELAILDWVMCNEKGLIRNLVVRDPLGKNDHNMVEFFIKMESDTVNSETRVLNLRKGNFDGMRRELASIDWQMLLKGLTIDRQWQTFIDHMDELQQLYIPVRSKNKTGKMAQPWLTNEIKDSVRSKEETYKLSRKSSKPEDWEKFRIQQRRTKGLIKRGKIEYERKLAGNIKTDCKSFYRYVKRKRLVKTNVGPLQSDSGELITGNKEMADQLNKYFGSVFTKEDTNDLPDVLGDRGSSEKEELMDILIRQEIVLGKLMGLKADKSPGPDCLHPRILKEVAREIVDALVIIFQQSYRLWISFYGLEGS
uniref:uncharacterized protein isoform X1 n=1 Tax=Pristiophorus japonicus TaxID=55135 RepID=UPI00398EB4CB